MKRSEYMERANNAYDEGKIDADTYDAMIINADIFCDDDDDDNGWDDRLPRTYAEIEYDEEDFENNPEAIYGARWDDMNYNFYMER